MGGRGRTTSGRVLRDIAKKRLESRNPPTDARRTPQVEVAFLASVAAVAVGLRGPESLPAPLGLFGPTAAARAPSTVGQGIWALSGLAGLNAVASWRRVVESSSLSGASHHKCLQGVVVGCVAALSGAPGDDVRRASYALLALAAYRLADLYSATVPDMRKRGCQGDADVFERGWQWSAALNADFYRHTFLATPLFLAASRVADGWSHPSREAPPGE